MRNVPRHHLAAEVDPGVRQPADLITEQKILDAAVNQVFIESGGFEEERAADCQVPAGDLEEARADAVEDVPHPELRAWIRAALEMVVPDVTGLDDAIAELLKAGEHRIDIVLGD